MNQQIVEVNISKWDAPSSQNQLITDLESGKVLHFTNLEFPVSEIEQQYFTAEIRDKKSRNISLNISGELKGVIKNNEAESNLAAMMTRYRTQSHLLVNTILPRYKDHLHLAPTSFRPNQIVTRNQSWRADDKRLHVDAFPSRPNYGERILRVFINVNPNKVPRVWRIGEPFEAIVDRFLADTKPYSAWQAKVLNAFGITKSLRSEYDHLMLQLHDSMKRDLNYQRNCPQLTVEFPTGSVWICFSDQTSHAAMSGQFMMEQTFHLPVLNQYNPNTSPLAILRNHMGHELI
ncbi:MAG: Kdo hydroxylase family protein [Methylococcales bacterium]|nr:Kdo hydroxylase family protein [Methylococcales bacterium]